MSKIVVLDLDDYLDAEDNVHDVADLVGWIRGGLGGKAFGKMAADIEEQAAEPVKEVQGVSLPGELYLGIAAHQWPISAMTTDGQAMFFLKDAKVDQPRRVWKARLVNLREFELVKPEPFLQEKQS